MYYLAVRQFARSLRALDAILEKAQAHAQTKKFDVNNFCSARLAPDMFPFIAQVRVACDYAKSTAANLAGKTAPRHEDNETTFEELRGRIRKCLAYIDTFTAQDFAGTKPETAIPIGYPQGKALRTDEYLFGRQIPNFYFHLTTAYNLLRAGGVEIGKYDFIGPLDLLDA